MNKYRIISLDGGGLRGIITLVILNRIVKEYPQLLTNTYMFAGTSTGGIAALSLAYGLTPERMIQLYTIQGGSFFSRSFGRTIWGCNGFLMAKYATSGLRQVLGSQFGDSTLGSIPKKVVVTTVDLSAVTQRGRRWTSSVLSNCGPSPNTNMPIVDAALATSAAPTYFPSFNGYVDGALMANSPSCVAISHLCDVVTDPAFDLQDVLLLSLGTGDWIKSIEGDNLDWGKSQWIMVIIDLLFAANTELVEAEAKSLLEDHYWRVDAVFDTGSPTPMDDFRTLSMLMEKASRVDIRPTIEWLKRNQW